MSNVVSLNTGEPIAPDFITRIDISTMNDEQLEELLEAIRSRRMMSFIIYEQTQADLELIQVEKAKVALEKQCAQIVKTLGTLDKNFEKLETQISKMRGLRIQAGLNII